jgi:hypothetical protein
MKQATNPPACDQLDFLLSVERLLKDAEVVRQTRDRLLESVRESTCPDQEKREAAPCPH